MCNLIETEKQKLYRLIDQQGILGKETIEQSRLIDKLILMGFETANNKKVTFQMSLKSL